LVESDYPLIYVDSYIGKVREPLKAIKLSTGGDMPRMATKLQFTPYICLKYEIACASLDDMIAKMRENVRMPAGWRHKL